MGKFVAVLISLFVVLAAQLPLVLTIPLTSPAFLWSSHQDGLKEGISYQTLSPKDLAKSVMTLGGWSNFLCLGKEAQPSVDFALLFVGRELQSSDISGSKHGDPVLLDMLKVFFTKSKQSLAFPYVSASEEREAMENSLVSEFADYCGHDLGASNVAFTESCSMDGANFEKLEDTHSMHDYFVSKMEKRSKGKTNLIVVCDAGSSSSKELEQSRESQVFSEVLSSAEQSGAQYSVLYVSDPLRSIQYPSNHVLQRFLAEGTTKNGSANSTTCDEVCQIKSSLLEGLFVERDKVVNDMWDVYTYGRAVMSTKFWQMTVELLLNFSDNQLNKPTKVEEN